MLFIEKLTVSKLYWRKYMPAGKYIKRLFDQSIEFTLKSKNLMYILRDSSVQHFPAILWYKNHMVLALPFRV